MVSRRDMLLTCIRNNAVPNLLRRPRRSLLPVVKRKKKRVNGPKRKQPVQPRRKRVVRCMPKSANVKPSPKTRFSLAMRPRQHRNENVKRGARGARSSRVKSGASLKFRPKKSSSSPTMPNCQMRPLQVVMKRIRPKWSNSVKPIRSPCSRRVLPR